MPASKILIVYGSQGGNALDAAKRIAKVLGPERCQTKDVAATSSSDLESAQALVLGSSTWGFGDLQEDWEAALTRLAAADVTGKRVAFFGVGDQCGYPDTFADAMGILFDSFVDRRIDHRGGGWPVVGYEFTDSRSIRDGAFVGLALDFENQPEETDARIAAWVATLGDF